MPYDTRVDPAIASAIRDKTAVGVETAQQSGLMDVAGKFDEIVKSNSKEAALEKRMQNEEGRLIAREKRASIKEKGLLEGAQTREDKLTEEKREYDKPLRSAQIKQAEAAARKSDRWEPASAGTTKTDNKDSTYTVDGKIITIGQAKVLQKEWEKSLPENSAEALDTAKRDIANVEKDMADEWFTSQRQATAFIKLYDTNPQSAKAKNPEAFNELDRATKIKNQLESGMQGYIDNKYGGRPASTGKPVVYRPKK